MTSAEIESVRALFRMLDHLEVTSRYATHEYIETCKLIWKVLPQDSLRQLMKVPTWDGDVISKAARDDLIALGLATRCCFKMEQGYTVATYLAYTVWKYGASDV